MFELFNWNLCVLAVFIIMASSIQNVWIKIGLIAIGIVLFVLSTQFREKQMKKRNQQKDITKKP